MKPQSVNSRLIIQEVQISRARNSGLGFIYGVSSRAQGVSKVSGSTVWLEVKGFQVYKG